MTIPPFISLAYAGVITDATPVSEVLGNVLEFLLQMFGVVAIIAFVGSGLLYILAMGNESAISRAKKWMLYSVLGVIASLGSLMVLSTIDSLL